LTRFAECPFFYHVQSLRSIREWSDIPRRYHSGPRLNFEFNPNVAPTELVPVLLAGEGIVLARFGINRLGSGDRPRPPLLNVRTDGMRKGQFRKHLKERRCVIPCEGFYEWRDEGGKQPYYFSRTRRRQGRRVAI
jgi:putative SOS response-associated peptidase YedK